MAAVKEVESQGQVDLMRDLLASQQLQINKMSERVDRCDKYIAHLERQLKNFIEVAQGMGGSFKRFTYHDPQ